MMDLDGVRALVEVAHHGVTDKIGDPYIQHVEAVAQGVAPFQDEKLTMGALLHDVIEDTAWTAGHLLRVGISERTVRMVEAVTNQKGVAYLTKMQRITAHPDGLLIKISDNAHNSRKDRNDRVIDPATRERLKVKYHAARDHLWAAAPEAHIRAIVRIVNPELEEELEDRIKANPGQW